MFLKLFMLFCIICLIIYFFLLNYTILQGLSFCYQLNFTQCWFYYIYYVDIITINLSVSIDIKCEISLHFPFYSARPMRPWYWQQKLLYAFMVSLKKFQKEKQWGFFWYLNVEFVWWLISIWYSHPYSSSRPLEVMKWL